MFPRSKGGKYASVAFAFLVREGIITQIPACIAGILSTYFCVGPSMTYLYRDLHSLRMLSKEGWED